MPVCVPDAAIICSQTKKAIGWDQPIIIVRSITPLRIFMAAWASIIFDEPTACRTNHFVFFIGSYPPGSLRLLTIVGATSGREAGGGTISFLLCVMALLPLAFGWLVLCGFLLVPCVWAVVEAVNNLDVFNIEYPDSEEVQLELACKFQSVSEVNFSNCAGAIDGILIWILKPSEEDAANAGCGRKKFFCGRKGKFGLNCQADFIVRGRILDLSIGLPSASSDCIVFEGSNLYEKLEDGLLKNGLVLFGDNAYLNTHYMATPFPNVLSGSKDDYIFSILRFIFESSALLEYLF